MTRKDLIEAIVEGAYSKEQAGRFKKAHDKYVKTADKYATAHMVGDIPGVHDRERDVAYDSWYTDRGKQQKKSKRKPNSAKKWGKRAAIGAGAGVAVYGGMKAATVLAGYHPKAKVRHAVSDLLARRKA